MHVTTLVHLVLACSGGGSPGAAVPLVEPTRLGAGPAPSALADAGSVHETPPLPATRPDGGLAAEPAPREAEGAAEPSPSPPTGEVSSAPDSRGSASPPPVGERSASGAARIRVLPGDTLYGLARMAGVPVEALADASGRRVGELLRPGEALLLPEGVDGEAVARAQREAFEARRERVLASRGGLVGVERYTVRTGDTAWDLARRAGVPLWVLASFNEGRNLDTLRVGDRLVLPVLGEDPRLALAEPPVEVEDGPGWEGGTLREDGE